MSDNIPDSSNSTTEDKSLEIRKDQEDSRSQDSHSQDSHSQDSREVDVMDLVSKGGYAGNPREIVENPAVAPQMMNLGQVDADNRDDMMDEADADEINEIN